MGDHSDRPFSRFYAQLKRTAGEDVPEAREESEPLGMPKVANPKYRDEST